MTGLAWRRTTAVSSAVARRLATAGEVSQGQLPPTVRPQGASCRRLCALGEPAPADCAPSGSQLPPTVRRGGGGAICRRHCAVTSHHRGQSSHLSIPSLAAPSNVRRIHLKSRQTRTWPAICFHTEGNRLGSPAAGRSPVQRVVAAYIYRSEVATTKNVASHLFQH